LLATFWIAAAVAGCSVARRYQPAQDPSTLDGTSFLHYLATVPVVSVEEGCRAMLLAADGAERYGSDEERMAELLRRGVVREVWNLRPGDVLDKGTLAYMAYKTCDLPGGLNMHLLASWGLGDRRFALKEAAAAGIMPYDSAHSPVRGGELVSVLTKMDEHLAEQEPAPAAPPGVRDPANRRSK
jgi:hypothetical protein